MRHNSDDSRRLNFKKGDKVICVDPGAYSLTRGKMYIVLAVSSTEDCILVHGDLDTVYPFMSRFRLVTVNSPVQLFRELV